MTFAAPFIGLLIVVQGLVGLAAPEFFARLIGEIQTPPIIYAAAFVRVLIGAILLRAARTSRAPKLLMLLGILIVIGGALTPVFGVQFGQLILGWWSQSTAIVRYFGVAAVAIGSFILYSTARRPSAT
jgi:uncharacterized protein YjeT (DUF2065 family)